MAANKRKPESDTRDDRRNRRRRRRRTCQHQPSTASRACIVVRWRLIFVGLDRSPSLAFVSSIYVARRAAAAATPTIQLPIAVAVSRTIGGLEATQIADDAVDAHTTTHTAGWTVGTRVRRTDRQRATREYTESNVPGAEVDARLTLVCVRMVGSTCSVFYSLPVVSRVLVISDPFFPLLVNNIGKSVFAMWRIKQAFEEGHTLLSAKFAVHGAAPTLLARIIQKMQQHQKKGNTQQQQTGKEGHTPVKGLTHIMLPSVDDTTINTR
jgi:hypothetical protein